eukprot:CAMPEP_0197048120 /NCGR_PEP_ID=MMETSP1384-20130603/23539_1 /TAXON_ID=29189 /ORGANISM="Ammonia sp." /LENGTH=53 /DNA_ID=CAMNT_0042480199 /DNA_START=57 /DNA_END=214 /DNA_ORIENTATION=-
MLGVYQGPSSMVRATTHFVQDPGNQPINPYYPQTAQPQPPPSVPQYNPAAVNA